jgi:ATP-dependent helicase Lhr and Lhr-like helicase
VEERFKSGELRVVVSSTSLELGIDIGSVDLAVLVHPPGDVVRLLQRIGRAGHEPGGVRRGLVLTASPAELLEAAVPVASGRWGQCEPLALPAAPLDVLCQHLLGMCCARSWPPEEMYDLARRAGPYAGLASADFDDCLAYLRGVARDGESWLPARLREDGDCWRVKDAKTARTLRRNIGTIVAERTVPVATRREPLLEDDMATPSYVPVGEVDEAFADRLQPGDRFLLDGKCLEYRARQEGLLVVEEVPGRPRVPRWGRAGWPLSPQLAHRLAALRGEAVEALREGQEALARLLRDDYELGDDAVAVLVAHFQQQELVSEVPDAATLLVEIVSPGFFTEYYLHTPLNQMANDALARVAVARLARDHGRSATSVVADLGLLLRVRGELPDAAESLRRLLAADGFTADLDSSLQEGEALRARFVRVAQAGLMLLRNPEGRKRKVGGEGWAERRLFEQVRAREPDFVLLRQALREVREELCDVPSALAYAEALPRLTVRCRHLSSPSPFAQAWSQAGPGESASAETPAEALARLHAELTGGGS